MPIDKSSWNLEYIKSEVKINKVIIIAISNDFKRGDAYQWQVNSKCYLTGICGENDHWYYLPINTPVKEIMDISLERSKNGIINFDLPKPEIILR